MLHTRRPAGGPSAQPAAVDEITDWVWGKVQTIETENKQQESNKLNLRLLISPSQLTSTYEEEGSDFRL